LTPRVVEELIGELPASERAALAWAPRALTESLERLFTAPQLSDALLEEAAASFLKHEQAFLVVIKGMVAEGQQGLFDQVRPLMEERAQSLRRLPVGLRRPAARALATCYVLVGIGLWVIEAGINVEPVLDPTKVDPDILAGTKAAVAVAGILHGTETGRALELRMRELILAADAEAFRLARMLAETKTEGVPMRLGWYFEDGQDAEKYRAFASWAEAETSKNDRLVEMLEEWKAEPEEPGEATAWEELKRALDEDRPSDRPLFP
jgi:hypothetical protein